MIMKDVRSKLTGMVDEGGGVGGGVGVGVGGVGIGVGVGGGGRAMGGDRVLVDVGRLVRVR